MKWELDWVGRNHQVSVVVARPEAFPEHPCLITFIKVLVHHLLVEVDQPDQRVHQLPAAAPHHLLREVKAYRLLEQLA